MYGAEKACVFLLFRNKLGGGNLFLIVCRTCACLNMKNENENVLYFAKLTYGKRFFVHVKINNELCIFSMSGFGLKKAIKKIKIKNCSLIFKFNSHRTLL